MLKVSETTAITFHVFNDTIKRFHGAIRKSAHMRSVSTSSFYENERIDDRFKVVVEGVSDISEQFETRESVFLNELP